MRTPLLVGLQNSASSKNIFKKKFPKKFFPPWSEMTPGAGVGGAERSEFLVSRCGGRGSSGTQHGMNDRPPPSHPEHTCCTSAGRPDKHAPSMNRNLTSETWKPCGGSVEQPRSTLTHTVTTLHVPSL